jgi:starvation-inducible outer membrane lipoprotein
VKLVAICGALLLAGCQTTPQTVQRAQALAAGTNWAGGAGANALCVQQLGIVGKPSSNPTATAVTCLPPPAAPVPRPQ